MELIAGEWKVEIMNGMGHAAPTVMPALTTYKSKKTAAYWGPRLVVISVAVWLSSFAIGFERALAIMVVIGFGAMIAGFRWPALGLIGIGITSAIDPLVRALIFDLSVGDSSLLRSNMLNYWLLIVILFSLHFLARLTDVQSRLMQLLVAVLSIGFLITPDLPSGVQHLLNFIVAFGLLCYFARAAEDLSNLYWLSVVVGSMAAVGNLAFYLQIESLPKLNPNSTSYFALTALFTICLSFRYAERQRRGQTLLMLLAVVNFMWVFLSSSRGSGFIAITCMIFLTAQIPNLSRRFNYIIAAVLLAVAISTLFADLQENSLHRFEMFVDSERSLTNKTSRRSDLVIVGWHLFLENPFGVGTGGYATFSGMGAAHSAWMKILAENGVPGIILFASYVFSFAVIGWFRRREEVFSLGLLGTTALSVAFLSNEFQGKGLWFFATGVTVLLHHKAIVTQMRKATQRTSSAITVIRPGVVNRV